MQESLRKDVDRAFGVLQSRYQIIDKRCKLWNQDNMKDIITACVILHNMIVEDDSAMTTPSSSDISLMSQIEFLSIFHQPVVFRTPTAE